MSQVELQEVKNEDEGEFLEFENWTLTAHVHGKQYVISAGDATQRVKWLAHVAIARWDEKDQQGWRKLGVPTSVKAHRRYVCDVYVCMYVHLIQTIGAL